MVTTSEPRSRREVLTSVSTVLAIGIAVPMAFLAVVAFGPPGTAGRNARVWVGFAPWWMLLALIATVLSLLLLRRRRRVGWWVLASLAVMSLVAHTVVTFQLLSVGWGQGVRVNPWAMPRSLVGSEGPDLTAAYTSGGDRDLSVLVWRPPPRAEAAPVLVYVHGGGWARGHPSGRAAQLRWFADQGWLVVAPEYSLSGPSRHFWKEAPRQIECAMTWVARNAAELGGDSNRLVMVGDSAGGNLAVNAAYEAARGTADPTCPGEVPRARAVVGLYAVLDPVAFHDDGIQPDARELSEMYVGGSPEEYPDRYREVASATHLSAEAPPTLLFVPGSDDFVPPDGARVFARQAEAAGVEVDLVELPHLGHAFDIAPLPDDLYRQITVNWLSGQLG
jgi:acetyl esterase